MNNYAFIKNNIIVDIVVFDTLTTDFLNLFKNSKNIDDIVLANEKTVIGGTYDGSKFWLPQPYPSWVKNEELNEWEAPVAFPIFDKTNPKFYAWNEEILNWQEVQVSE